LPTADEARVTIANHASLARHRRAVEAGQLVARGCGIVLTVMLTAGLLGIFPEDVPPALTATCLGMTALMVTAEVLGAMNFRSPTGAGYALRSSIQVAFDLIVMCAFVAGLHLYTEITVWPALVVPIVIAALRFRLAGALAAWALTSAFLPFALSLSDQPAPRGELVFSVCVNVIVGVISGTQAGAFARHVDELDRARRTLEHQAAHDPLTGLPNRIKLAQFAEHHRSQALAVLLLDLNGFKQINDSWGHAAGDAVLCATAHRIRATIRDGDLAVRLGGDEFQVLLPDTEPAQVAAVTERLRAAITTPVQVADHLVMVGASIGTAYRRAGEDITLEALTASADQGMYAEKGTTPRRPRGPAEEADRSTAW
jgi:diguanylate cyclase (GGDEF)-like protein